MHQPSSTRRVEILEEKVEAIERLPDRMAAVESQILQLRDETRVWSSALREEMAKLGRTIRDEMRAGDDALRTELLAEIRAGDEETRRYMRVLHEEVIERIARLQEGGSARGRRRR